MNDDVEFLAKQEYANTKRCLSIKWFEESMEVNRKRTAFIKGYNKAKEKYKYTQKDVENAFNNGREYGGNK